MQRRAELGTIASRCGLVLIIGVAAVVALQWVYRVPIFQSPDEPAHYDYALCLYQTGKLLRAPALGPNENPGALRHPYTDYLAARTALGELIRDPGLRMALDYGTPAYFAELERDAPPPAQRRVHQAPGLAGLYPFGYYAAVALWLKANRWWMGDGPVALLFSARLFSVVLLAISLALTYMAARGYQARRGTALLLTAVIGCFPMVSFIGSYIQPDNLALTLVSACFYLTARRRRAPNHYGSLAALGLVLGMLAVTKVHFFACMVVPILAQLLTRWLTQWPGWAGALRTLALLAIPSAVLGSVSAYLMAPAHNYLAQSAPYTDFNSFYLNGFTRALSDFYMGCTHISFWGVFGWLQVALVIGTPATDEIVRFIVQAGAWVLLALTLVRLEQVSARLITVARGGHFRRSLQMACGHVPVNSYFLFTGFMFGLYIQSNNRFGAQGRNWIPFMLPIFWTGLLYAPRALTMPLLRRALQCAVAAVLVFYATVGNYFGLQSLEHHFYYSATELAELKARTAEIRCAVSLAELAAASVGQPTRQFAFECPVERLNAIELPVAIWKDGLPTQIRLELTSAQGERLAEATWAASAGPTDRYLTFSLSGLDGLQGKRLTVRLTEQAAIRAPIVFVSQQRAPAALEARLVYQAIAVRTDPGRGIPHVLGAAKDGQLVSLTAGPIASPFVAPFDALAGVEILLSTYGGKNAGQVCLELLDANGQWLAASTVAAEQLRDNRYQWFPLPEIAGIKGRAFQLRLSYALPPGANGNIVGWATPTAPRLLVACIRGSR